MYTYSNFIVWYEHDAFENRSPVSVSEQTHFGVVDSNDSPSK